MHQRHARAAPTAIGFHQAGQRPAGAPRTHVGRRLQQAGFGNPDVPGGGQSQTRDAAEGGRKIRGPAERSFDQTADAVVRRCRVVTGVQSGNRAFVARHHKVGLHRMQCSGQRPGGGERLIPRYRIQSAHGRQRAAVRANGANAGTRVAKCHGEASSLRPPCRGRQQNSTLHCNTVPIAIT